MASTEKEKEQSRLYYQSHKASHKAKAVAWQKKNPDAFKRIRLKYKNKRYEKDLAFRVASNQRTRINALLRLNKVKKTKRSLGLVGCSSQELKKHIESLWEPGMNWDNHGLFGWHIDHKIPCSSFDLTKEAEQIKCFHYTNLQPMWAADNIKKSNKFLQPV